MVVAYVTWALKKLIILAVCATAALSVVAMLATHQDPPDIAESVTEDTVDVIPEPDVVMPTKSSRPGCEEEDLCYIPETVTIKAGQSLVWMNEDAAFHSVTSGTYEEPDGLFDSGYMDPADTFSYTFEDTGTYEYYCTLHPWMAGTVTVE